jgi:hypothetical protein
LGRPRQAAHFFCHGWWRDQLTNFSYRPLIGVKCVDGFVNRVDGSVNRPTLWDGKMKTVVRAEQQVEQLVAAGSHATAVNIFHTLDRLDRMGFDSDDIIALVNGRYEVYVVDAGGTFIVAIGKRGGTIGDHVFTTLLPQQPTNDHEKRYVGTLAADLAGIVPMQCVAVP